MNKERIEKLELLKECLLDYVVPIYIVGNIDKLNFATDNIISATQGQLNLEIINNRYPLWLQKAIDNSGNLYNILIIKDFDKISLDEQSFFIDIICYKRISSQLLPDDLKIIVNSESECKLIPKLHDRFEFIKL